MLALVLVSPCTAADLEPGTIRVSAKQVEVCDADFAIVSFEIVMVDSSSASKVAGDVAKRHNNISSNLKPLGFRPEDLTTTKFAVEEVIDKDFRTNQTVFKGYRAQHSVKIRVSDFQIIGKIVDAVLKGGATRVTGIKFGSTEEEKYYDIALEKAVQRAKKEAEIAASAVGEKLGHLSYLHFDLQPFDVEGASYSNESATNQLPSVPTIIVPDKIKVRVSVSAGWECAVD